MERIMVEIDGVAYDGYTFGWNGINLNMIKPSPNSWAIYYKQQLVVSGTGTRRDIIKRIPKEFVDIVKYL